MSDYQKLLAKHKSSPTTDFRYTFQFFPPGFLVTFLPTGESVHASVDELIPLLHL